MRRSCCFAFVFLLCGILRAEYIPNTLWPYLYEDFCSGELVLKNGDKVRASFNIHLQEGELHYLKGDDILFVGISRVSEVVIGEERYIPLEGHMMRVVSQDAGNYLTESILGDFESLFVGTGAYGASANTQAVRNLSSIEIGGKSIVNHAILLQNKEDGKELPTIQKYYLFIGGKCVPANKKEVEKSLIINKEGWRTFLKENKIKWRKQESQVKVLHYFSE